MVKRVIRCMHWHNLNTRVVYFSFSLTCRLHIWTPSPSLAKSIHLANEWPIFHFAPRGHDACLYSRLRQELHIFSNDLTLNDHIKVGRVHQKSQLIYTFSLLINYVSQVIFEERNGTTFKFPILNCIGPKSCLHKQ
jgi:hypothetical protein